MTKVLGEMTRKVVFALETDSLDEVWISMRSTGVRHIPVLSNHKVIGILSDRDILRLGKLTKSGELKVPHQKISSFMTKDVITCSTLDSVATVASAFIKHKIDALPVVAENGDLVGIITSTDLLRLLTEKHGGPFQELPFPWEPESLRKEYWRPAMS